MSLDSFIEKSISLRSLPALPTKGSPLKSSSFPGASPIISTLAFWLPLPKTTLSNKKARIRSPGMMKRHYSPGIPIVFGKKKISSNHAFIVFGKKYKNRKNYFNLSRKGNLKEAAANLYKTMRKIKKRKY